MTHNELPYFHHVLLVLLVTGVVISSVLAQGNDPSPSGNGSPTEDSVQRLLDENGNILTDDDRMLQIAQNMTGGFGGFYFDDAKPEIAYVYMKDTTDKTSAKKAFEAAYNGQRNITTVVPVQGSYAFNDLVHWFRALDNAMIEYGIYMVSGSVRELDNQILVGLSDMADKPTVLGIMRRLNIPEGAVCFEEDETSLLADKDSVTAKWRPLVGGIQHHAHKYGPLPRRYGRAAEFRRFMWWEKNGCMANKITVSSSG